MALVGYTLNPPMNVAFFFFFFFLKREFQFMASVPNNRSHKRS